MDIQSARQNKLVSKEQKKIWADIMALMDKLDFDTVIVGERENMLHFNDNFGQSQFKSMSILSKAVYTLFESAYQQMEGHKNK